MDYLDQSIERINLSSSSYYNNRELSWLGFNERVLEEAIDMRNPLLERLKFLSIFSSNLDEFFMVRVAGLKDQVAAEFEKPENKAGLTPKEQLSKIFEINHRLVNHQYKTFTHTLLPSLQEEHIYLLKCEELTDTQLTFVNDHFENQIYPSLTPMAIDAYRPFPVIPNKALNIAVMLHKKNEKMSENHLAIVRIPPALDRFIEIPSIDSKRCFILLEDVISHNCYKLFEGYQVISTSQFRITRNGDLSIHEEGARDLLEVIEEELKKRKWGAAVRLEIRKDWNDNAATRFLIEKLELHEKDVYIVDGPIDLTFLFAFYKTLSNTHDHLLFESLVPKIPRALQNDRSIFSTLLKKDVFLHHPFESFDPIVDFIKQASVDPKVLAIKQTLYRVSDDSPIINALAKASENGKLVTVLVELKARFDEENNIQWAKKLEKSGVNVIYGMTSLKTHSKITLVVRKERNVIQRFVHLGTGNYNDATAKIYTDMGLLTSNQHLGIDATNFFNYLSGYRTKPDWYYFSISPGEIKETFITLIEKEMEHHKRTGRGRIIAKMNSLTDKDLIMQFYKASQAGVKIDLIVRGICCLRPGIEGVSSHITVRSIVGQFLEHTRIFYFHHSGEEKIYLSSADMMTRNMDKRIEILFPILQSNLKQKVRTTLDLILKDNVKARIQDSKGIYHYVEKKQNEPVINSQQKLMQNPFSYM
ncbi:RNA degradosome polyphosphate kinase [Bacillus sp. RAR_GA_16]|uniref:RNA degradosome polyphosphate kinase n=1 Tax=Bacillus sp. RAR_GA_16 TaxID=2876774 RepID=UPI001CCDF437|nr:RNA degradosome polyphosphate kinase [Bacillus sp. RAR_GA_16]MCA0171856.1 RNA degradosome polyphosphate kinase [Bacillus sp. RAR_GA_16]